MTEARRDWSDLIRSGRSDDLAALVEIELAAGAKFRELGSAGILGCAVAWAVFGNDP